ELLHLVEDGMQNGIRRLIPPAAERLDQTLLSEFLVRVVKGFGNSVRIKCECISRAEPGFIDRTIPFPEEAHYRARGIEAFHGAIGAQEQRGEMPAVRITKAARIIVVFGEEEGRVGALRRILVKELVYRSQQPLRL